MENNITSVTIGYSGNNAPLNTTAYLGMLTISNVTEYCSPNIIYQYILTSTIVYTTIDNFGIITTIQPLDFSAQIITNMSQKSITNLPLSSAIIIPGTINPLQIGNLIVV